MEVDTYVSAEQRRKAIQDHAASIGIDEAYIAILVDSFYGHIRSDATLGPIFEAKISGNWDVHLGKMKQFWASVAMNSGTYSGKPVPAHQNLHEVTPQHFDLWLALFHKTLVETAPSPEAIPYFLERAQRIAQSLKLAMFGHLEIPRAVQR